MKILLLTKNHIVKEFVELAADKVSAKLISCEDISSVPSKKYDFVFVDDRGDLLQNSLELLEKFPNCISVVLYSQENESYKQFDIKIKKPFLPSEIQSVLEYEEFGAEEIKEYDPQDQILNLAEVEQIKKLLDGEELEIIAEEKLADEIDGNISLQTDSKEEMSQKLLEALLEMEPKKIRKALKGAEIKIEIRFPKDNT